MHDRNSMRLLLLNSGRTVEKGLYLLWCHQTSDERVASDTRYRNHRGFSHVTVEDGTRVGGKIARIVAAFLAEGHTLKTIPWGSLLVLPKDSAVAFEVCHHHAGQLASIANEEKKKAA